MFSCLSETSKQLWTLWGKNCRNGNLLGKPFGHIKQSNKTWGEGKYIFYYYLFLHQLIWWVTLKGSLTEPEKLRKLWYSIVHTRTYKLPAFTQFWYGHQPPPVADLLIPPWRMASRMEMCVCAIHNSTREPEIQGLGKSVGTCPWRLQGTYQRKDLIFASVTVGTAAPTMKSCWADFLCCSWHCRPSLFQSEIFAYGFVMCYWLHLPQIWNFCSLFSGEICHDFAKSFPLTSKAFKICKACTFSHFSLSLWTQPAEAVRFKSLFLVTVAEDSIVQGISLSWHFCLPLFLSQIQYSSKYLQACCRWAKVPWVQLFCELIHSLKILSASFESILKYWGSLGWKQHVLCQQCRGRTFNYKSKNNISKHIP